MIAVVARPRVLLADDHPGIVKALSRVLSLECYVAGVVADGRKVADAAAQLQPVVILVDLNLSHVNGLDVCREITHQNPHAKVIVMTAMIDDVIREQACAAGASSCFDKCASTDNLIVDIKRAWREST